MKSMLAVVRLISRQKLRKLDILTEDMLDAKSSKFRELYEALQDGTVRNDREAAALLYDSGPTDARYRQLKSRFRRRLFNTVFFVDQNRPRATSFDQTYHNCQREWSLINILRANDALVPAEVQARSLLKVCEQYGFAELSVQSARFLADLHAGRGDAKSVAAHEQIIATASATYRDELASEGLLREVRLLARRCAELAGAAPDQEATARSLGQRLDAVAARCHSAVVVYNVLEGWCRIFQLLGERERAIEVVARAVAYSQASDRQLQETRLRELRQRQLHAFIELGDTARGVAAVEAAELDCRPGDPNWYTLRKLEVALLLAGEAPQRALQRCQLVRQHRSFAAQAAPEREAWDLLEAASWVSARQGDAAGVPGGFVPEAFLRKSASFGGDYLRLNAWRLLLQAAVRRAEGGHEAVHTNIDELRELAIRHLDGARDVRLVSVAQVLYRAARVRFQLGADRVAERHLRRLAETRFAARVAPTAFEPMALELVLPWFGVEATVPA